MSTASLDRPIPLTLRPDLSRDDRFRFLTFEEDLAVIASHRVSGKTLDGAQVIDVFSMIDGDYVTLPLLVDWRQSEKALGDFWVVYPRTLIHAEITYRYVGTHVGNRVVLYRAVA